MPAQPLWFHRLDVILEELEALPLSYLDRAAIQQLFQVSERRARQILAGMECVRVGNATAVSREALLLRLRGIATEGRFRQEVRRRVRVVEELEALRRQAKARDIKITVSRESLPQSLRDLTPGIDLRPGELRICFEGAQDLAAKLYELSQALANDWESFSAL